jgi:DNA polymerase-3 subunit epsilon
MREIILDTETTGLNPSEGHKVIEIAAIEIIDFLPRGTFLNSQQISMV